MPKISGQLQVFLFVLFIGLIIRLILVGNPGFEADISFWKSWSLAAIDHGVVWTSHNTNINYPPAFIYCLWLMGKIYSVFADPHNFNDFWRVNNFAFLLSSKSIAIVSDITIACLIYWFFSQKEKLKQLGATINATMHNDTMNHVKTKLDHWSIGSLEHFIHVNLPLILAACFYLNPIVIIDSALWGQVESFGFLFTIIAVLLIFYKKPIPAAFIFTIGCLMKLQNIIYIPVFYLFIFRYFDLSTAVKSAVATAVAFILATLPFILANDLNQVLYLLTVNSDYFPWLSLNAHNIWWIAAAGHGMQITDRITALGILNAKTVGLVLFSASYLLPVILILKRPTARNFLLSLAYVIFAFFLFTTQSHERYSYPVAILLLFLYPFLENKFIKHEARSTKSETNLNSPHSNIKQFSNFEFRISNLQLYFWLIYLLFSINIFFNIHTGLILNYPHAGFPIISMLTSTTTTIIDSFLSITLYFSLLPFFFSQISFLFFAFCCLTLISGLITLNASYLFKGEVSLTKFKPVISSQDFGVLQVNRSVNSYTGWKAWNRLSVDYMFYREGFGTHANSKLVFDIARKFRKFATDFGIDTEAATPASAIFIVKADGKELYRSPQMGRFDWPKHVELDVTNVKNLSLEVNDAGDGINSDHADWLNPILYK
jgi:Gpi18-like mannosyltransferase